MEKKPYLIGLALLLSSGILPEASYAKEVEIDAHNLLIVTEEDIASINKILGEIDLNATSSSPSSYSPSLSTPSLSTPSLQEASESVSSGSTLVDDSSPQTKYQKVGEQSPVGDRAKLLAKQKKQIQQDGITAVILKLAKLECSTHSCGERHCVDFVNYKIRKKRITPRMLERVLQRKLNFNVSSKEIEVTNDYTTTRLLEKQIKHKINSGGPLGVFFESVTCTDDPSKSYETVHSKDVNPIDVLQAYDVTVNYLQKFPETYSCSKPASYSTWGVVRRLFEDNPNEAIVISTMVEAAIGAAPAVIGALSVGITGALAGAAIGRSAGVAMIQNSVSETVRNFAGHQFKSLATTEQQLYSSNRKNLEFLEEIYEANRAEIYLPNRELIDRTIAHLKNDIAKRRLDSLKNKLKMKEQEAIRDQIQGLTSTLALATHTVKVPDQSANELKNFLAGNHFTKDTTKDILRMASNIDNISKMDPHYDTLVPLSPYYYVQGPPKSGKSELVKNLSKSLGLETYHLKMTNRPVADIKDEFDRVLLKSTAKNPIIIMEDAGRLIGDSPNQNDEAINWFKEMLVSKQSKLESAIATKAILGEEQKATIQHGGKLVNPNIAGAKIYHDLSRVTFLLTGESPLSDSRLLDKFHTIQLPPIAKEGLVPKAEEAFYRALQGSDLNRDKISEADLRILNEIIELGAKRNAGTTIIEKVTAAFANHLRIKNGESNKYGIEEEGEFDFHKEYNHYLGQAHESDSK